MFCPQGPKPVSAVVSRLLAHIHLLTLATLCILAVPRPGFSQTPSSKETSVPRMIRYAGVAHDLNNKPLGGLPRFLRLGEFAISSWFALGIGKP